MQQPVNARRHEFHPRVYLIVLACLVLVVGLGIARVLWPPRRSTAVQTASFASQSGSSPWLNTRPGVKYVGDAVWPAATPTLPRRSTAIPWADRWLPLPLPQWLVLPGPAERRRSPPVLPVLTIERRDGREIHRETVRDGDKVLAQVEGEVAYSVDRVRSISYLVEHDGRLFMSPITWYTQKARWDLSPGYEKAHAHFDRPIDPDCLFCHSNRVRPVALSANRYQEPVFLGHTIGCERCHGPGELHERRQELSGGRDLTIVNPRHLDPVLRGNICEQCHLVGEQRVNRLGRDAVDYRPGLPLTDFFVDHGLATEEGQQLVGQVLQMKSSTCFRASRGRLGCTTCHDPHEIPDADEKVAYFREKCLACHNDHGCKLPEPVRLARNKDDFCAGCHMPAAKAVDAVHIAVRDHRILREPDAGSTAPCAVRRCFRWSGSMETSARKNPRCPIESWRSP